MAAWVEAAAAAAGDAVGEPLAALAELIGRPVGAGEVDGWRDEHPEDVARRLLHPKPEQLPPIDRVQMVEVMSLIMDPVADPIDVERWSAGLALVTGDAAFHELVHELAPGPTPEDVIDWALARGQGRPVPLVRRDGLLHVKGARGPLTGTPLLRWLQDAKAQQEAPGLPATIRRLCKDLPVDADPDDILDEVRDKLPATVMRLLEARIAVWAADQD